MKTQWRNVAGTYSIEIYTHELRAYDTDDQELSCLSAFCFVHGIADGELIIEFNSSGYNDPGSMYGGPDNLGYPPEGDDERLLDACYIDDRKVSDAIANELFDLYLSQIEEVELVYDDE